MNKTFTKAVAGILLAVLMTTSLAAAFDYGEIAPGDVAEIDKGEFSQRGSGYVIESGVKLTDSNFTIQKKTIKTGSNLVESIKINNRAEAVQVRFKATGIVQAPKRPNVVISELSLRAVRSIRGSGGEYELKSGDIYTLGSEITFQVGLSTTDMTPERDGVTMTLQSGEQQYVRWTGGSGYGKVMLDYGGMLYGEGRVYDGDKVLYHYSATVDDRLQDRNPNAYITAVDMGAGTFPQTVKVQLMANQEDYVYEYNDGRLSASSLKWSRDDAAWVGSLSKGRYFIVSDTKLSGISGATGSGGNSSNNDNYDDEETADPPFNNDYYNPSTGGSNPAVAISAIMAIVAIAVVSIIMSTILDAKKFKKD